MEGRLLIELIRLLFLLVVWLCKLLFRIVSFLLRTLFRPFGAIARGFRLEGPGGPAPAPVETAELQPPSPPLPPRPPWPPPMSENAERISVSAMTFFIW